MRAKLPCDAPTASFTRVGSCCGKASAAEIVYVSGVCPQALTADNDTPRADKKRNARLRHSRHSRHFRHHSFLTSGPRYRSVSLFRASQIQFRDRRMPARGAADTEVRLPGERSSAARRDSEFLLDFGHGAGFVIEELVVDFFPPAELGDREQVLGSRELL